MRERKRLDTLATIHEAAYALTMEHGISGTTVDEIADRAGLSRRTFFNYYPSKEDAILGLTELHIPDDALTKFRSARTPADRLRRTVDLMLAVHQSGYMGGSTVSRRIALVAQYPQLGARQWQQRTRSQELLMGALTSGPVGQPTRQGAGPPPGAEVAHPPPGPVSSHEEASLLIQMAGAVLRMAYERDPRSIDGGHPQVIAAALEDFRSFAKEM